MYCPVSSPEFSSREILSVALVQAKSVEKESLDLFDDAGQFTTTIDGQCYRWGSPISRSLKYLDVFTFWPSMRVEMSLFVDLGRQEICSGRQDMLEVRSGWASLTVDSPTDAPQRSSALKSPNPGRDFAVKSERRRPQTAHGRYDRIAVLPHLTPSVCLR